MTLGYSRREFLQTAGLAGAAAAAPELARGLTWAEVSAAAPARAQAASDLDLLHQYVVPDWFRDAKFGIFLHWGVYSVPGHASEWYPRLMYQRRDPVFAWHRAHYGPQDRFGYKDFIPHFTAWNWNPERWVDLFQRAGAKYVVPVGEHHDGFPMYDCSYTKWTAVRMGPRRDVVGELARALRAAGLKVGVSSHRGFNWSYYAFAPDFDTAHPAYAGLYGTAHAPTTPVAPRDIRQTASPAFVHDWYLRSAEIVDRYRPDFFYFDWAMSAPEFERQRLRFAAHYYRQAARWGRGVVLTYKNGAYAPGTAVLDIERGQAQQIEAAPWQTDTSVSWRSWGYIKDDSFKTPRQLLSEFIEIVAKNGCLLLNTGPTPDGMITPQAEQILLAIGGWLAVHGEGIYGTRPWVRFGEGPSQVKAGSFGEKPREFTAQDFRFTRQGDRLYAFCLGWPQTEFVIRSLGAAQHDAPKIADVRWLGDDAKLDWHQADDGLHVAIGTRKAPPLPCALRLVIAGA